jgi:hypothetical protein
MSEFLNYSAAYGDGSYTILGGSETDPTEIVFVEFVPKSTDKPYIVLIGMDANTGEILATMIVDMGLTEHAPGLYLHPYLFQSVACKEVMNIFADHLNGTPDSLRELGLHWQQVNNSSDHLKITTAIHVIETPLTLLDDPKIVSDKELQNQVLEDLFQARQPKRWFELEDQPELLADFNPHQSGGFSDLQAEWHDRAYMAMRTEPDWLFMVAEKLIHYYEPKERNQVPKSYFAYLVIMRESLFRLGLDVARGFPYADWLNAKFQRFLIDKILVPEMGQLLQQDFIDALARSRLPIQDSFKEAQFNLADYYSRFQKDRNVPDMGKYLEDLYADGLTDPFEIYEHFVSHLRLMHEEERFFLIEEMSRTQHEGVQVLMGLFNLHPDPAIRASVRNHMSHFTGPAWMSQVTLRRLILMRNWLPESERPQLDRLIKLNRMARVACEPVGEGQLKAVFASSLDGTGSCGIWLFSATGNHCHHTHIVLKQGEGVHESWFMELADQEAMEQEIQQIHKSPEFGELDASFLAQLMSHFIYTGQQHQKVPHGSLLQVVERLGNLDWDPEPLTVEMLKEHCEQYDRNAGSSADESIQPILEALGNTPQFFRFKPDQPSGIYQYPGLETWFDESHDLETFLKETFGEPIHWMYRVFEISGAIADQCLEKQRQNWQERLMLNAFYYLAIEGMARPTWRIYAQDALAIASGMALSQIPVMQNIAMRTLQAAFDRHRFGEAWEEILNPKTVPFPIKKTPS